MLGGTRAHGQQFDKLTAFAQAQIMAIPFRIISACVRTCGDAPKRPGVALAIPTRAHTRTHALLVYIRSYYRQQRRWQRWKLRKLNIENIHPQLRFSAPACEMRAPILPISSVKYASANPSIKRNSISGVGIERCVLFHKRGCDG